MDKTMKVEFPFGMLAGEFEWRGGGAEASGLVELPTDRPVTFVPFSAGSRGVDLDDSENHLRPLSIEYVGSLPAMRQVRCVDLPWRSSDRFVGRLVESMRWIESLSLFDTFMTDRTLRRVAALPDLRELRILDASRLSFASCRSLEGADKLDHLRLSLLAKRGPGLSALAELPALRSLDLSHTVSMSDADLAEIVELQQLEELDLRYCVGLTRKSLRLLELLPNLRRVDVSGLRVSPKEIETFKQRIKRRRVVTGSKPSNSVESPGGQEKVRASSGGGRVQDPRVRVAVERWAVRRAVQHLEALGCEDIQDVGALKSWDLECTHGNEQWRVEVKGTQSALGPIELTVNEVANARELRSGRGRVRLGLFICTGIAIDEREEGRPVASGGTPLWIFPWVLDDSLLSPTKFSYDAHLAIAARG